MYESDFNEFVPRLILNPQSSILSLLLEVIVWWIYKEQTILSGLIAKSSSQPTFKKNKNNWNEYSE